jgi:hypothetical protein
MPGGGVSGQFGAAPWWLSAARGDRVRNKIQQSGNEYETERIDKRNLTETRRWQKHVYSEMHFYAGVTGSRGT